MGKRSQRNKVELSSVRGSEKKYNVEPIFRGAKPSKEWDPLNKPETERRDQSYIRKIKPQNPNQAALMEAMAQHNLVVAVGPAGTGKTYLAMAMAVSYLTQRRVKRIILTRPAVEAGEKLGFLPGDLAEKVNPYLRPLYDAMHDMMDMDKAQALIQRGGIEVAPLAFMRGRTLNESFVILDEAQNTTAVPM